MKDTIYIAGELGNFGSFSKELLAPHFEFGSKIHSRIIILAVPSSEYDNAIQSLGISSAWKLQDRHLINVCSIQSTTTNTCLKYTKNVTSIHPLFGRRTPEDKRNSILTYECHNELENEFLKTFLKVSKIHFLDKMGVQYTPISHDMQMAKTHKKALRAAQLIKPFVTDTADIPDELIPNSFRLMRDFVKTMEDMPAGTISSILANPYE